MSGACFGGGAMLNAAALVLLLSCDATARHTGTLAPGSCFRTAAPTISPVSGIVDGSQAVTITAQGANTVIFYTTDGTTPTLRSPVYLAPFLITRDMTVKAAAMTACKGLGPPATATYTYAGSSNVMSVLADTTPRCVPTGSVIGTRGETISITRATPANYIDNSGGVHICGPNEGRIGCDYQFTGECGYLFDQAEGYSNGITDGHRSHFEHAAWGPTGTGVAAPVVTPDAAVDPAGMTSADRIDFAAINASGQRSILAHAAGCGVAACSIDVWLKAVGAPCTVYLQALGAMAGQSTACVAGSTWSRCYRSAASDLTYFILGPDGAPASGQPTTQPACSVYAWNAQDTGSSYPNTPILDGQPARDADLAVITGPLGASDTSWRFSLVATPLAGRAWNTASRTLLSYSKFTPYESSTGLRVWTSDGGNTREWASTDPVSAGSHLVSVNVVPGALGVYVDSNLLDMPSTGSGTGVIPSPPGSTFQLGASDLYNFRYSGFLSNLSIDTAATRPVYATFDVDAATTYQTIDGFGVDVIDQPPMPAATLDALFSVTTGIGLRFVRAYADRDNTEGVLWTNPTCGQSYYLANLRGAVTRGADIIGDVMQVPTAWTVGGAGGHATLDPSHYADEATRLDNFIASIGSTSGLKPLHSMSIINEPNTGFFTGYSGDDLRDFLRDHLGPRVAANHPGVPLVVGQPSSAALLPSYLDPTLADTVATGYLGIVATHGYGGAVDYMAAKLAGKPLWQMEWNDSVMTPAPPFDASMTSGLKSAKSIHDFFALGYSMWAFWWASGNYLHFTNLSNGDCTATGTDWTGYNFGILGYGFTPTKRLYTIGNYAKFVRPGYQRVAVTGDTGAATLSAYTGGGRTVVVAINERSDAVDVRVNVAAASRATPWITDATRDLAQQSDVFGSGTFTYELPPQSVVTFVVR